MANGIKTYQIKINGIQESVDGIKALIDLLNSLEIRINALETAKIDISSKVDISSPSSSGVGDKVRSGALSEEDKLEKSILQTEEKIKATQTERYQQLLAEKDLLKEAVEDQKQRAAQERLIADSYSNTMAGMKQELADLKSVMQTTDLGSGEFKQMSDRAGELTQKLKDIEAAYGTFSRNVGNYASAAEGFKKLQINVGGVAKEFDNARQAMKALKTEMQTLSTKKDMGLISPEEAQRLKDLIPTVKQLESSIQDAGKPMDALMDSMQSIVALASAGKGIAAFFGIDDKDINRSIQQLVALQNAMKSIQTIQKQLQTGEGIGKYFSKGGEAIDDFVNKLFRIKKATDEVTDAEEIAAAATTEVETASKAATVAEETQTVATKSLTKAQKAATVAAKALSVVLKSIGIGLAIYAVTKLVDGVSEWIKSLSTLSAEEEAAKKATEASAEAYAKATTELNVYMAKIDNFNGSVKQEKQLVDELNKKYGEQMGTYKSLVEWKQALIEKSEAYVKQLQIEAEAEVYKEELTNAIKERIALEKMLDGIIDEGKAGTWQYEMAVDALNKAYKIESNLLDELIKKQKELAASGKGVVTTIRDIVAQIRTMATDVINRNSGTTVTGVDSRVKAEEVIQELTLKLMRDGLRKRLLELDDERRKTLAKVKGTAEQKLQVEKLYNELSLKEVRNYVDSVEKEYERLDKEKDELVLSDYENYITKNELEKNSVRNSKNQIFGTYISDIPIISREEYERYKAQYDELYKKADEVREINEKLADGYEKEAEKIWDDKALHYQEDLTSSFKHMSELLDTYRNTNLLNESEYLERIVEYKKKEAYKRTEIEVSAATAENNAKIEEYEQQLKELDTFGENYISEKNRLDKAINELTELNQEKERILWEKNANEIEKIQQDEYSELSSITEKYYSKELSNLSKFTSKLSKEISIQPTLFKGTDIIDYKSTKKQYKEVLSSIETVIGRIRLDKDKLNEDWKAGLITDEVYNATNSKLDDEQVKFEEWCADISDKIKGLPANTWGTIDQYIQMVGQAAQQIMSSIWDYQDNVYDRQIRDIEKAIDEQEKLLDKQEEIIRKHADSVNSIEDELSNARGDRRQHLIDQLNAEIQAQRQAAAEEKQIQKKKDALEKDIEKKKKEQWEKEKARNITTALMNAAMAISSAAANHWPLPAIPMIALATAVGAAQVASIEAQRYPYAKGGLLEGPSHREGGIPVGNTGIEVEGQEYVIRKKSTRENVPVLDFINKSERKLTLDDFIDFYSTKPRATIKNIKSKFADGGVIPSTSSLDISEQLQNIIINQDNRPIYVSVVDINNKQADVRRVQALAGL